MDNDKISVDRMEYERMVERNAICEFLILYWKSERSYIAEHIFADMMSCANVYAHEGAIPKKKEDSE